MEIIYDDTLIKWRAFVVLSAQMRAILSYTVYDIWYTYSSYSGHLDSKTTATNNPAINVNSYINFLKLAQEGISQGFGSSCLSRKMSTKDNPWRSPRK